LNNDPEEIPTTEEQHGTPLTAKTIKKQNKQK
jgi:hypothetical protein